MARASNQGGSRRDRGSSGSGSGGGSRSGSGGGRGSRSSTKRAQTKRHYPRTARLNALLQEIVASYLERLDDERIGFLTVTGVEVDNDLNKAEVFISTFEDFESVEVDEEFLAALTEYRKPVQAEIAREARLRKTPEVVFLFDPAVRTGARIEEILSALGPSLSDNDGDSVAGESIPDADGEPIDADQETE
ncbi:MAG: 30S ribosome-binding factor RbfA [Acidimicrobiales bacterium]